jgi:hypothetical protein
LYGVRRFESGRHPHQGAKGANHQAGTNQQNERQGNLQNHQGIASAVPLAALAERSSSLAKARRLHVRLHISGWGSRQSEDW